MKINIDYPIKLNGKIKDVVLIADCNMINTGIGGYEYMGSVEFDKGEDIIKIQNISWHKYLYTIHENNVIAIETDKDECREAFENQFRETIADRFC